MTIKTPREDFFDKVLKMLGKKRALYLPNAFDREDLYIQVRARKEPFLKALLRPRNSPLPKGWIYMDDFLNNLNSRLL